MRLDRERRELWVTREEGLALHRCEGPTEMTCVMALAGLPTADVVEIVEGGWSYRVIVEGGPCDYRADEAWTEEARDDGSGA